MKIVITGATGFVGAHLTRYFSEQGHTVLALGRVPQAPKQLYDYAAYQSIVFDENMPKIEADLVIHAAALASDSASYDDLYQANVNATKHLVKASSECPNFVLISSSSVYSFKDNKPKNESEAGADYQNLTDYGKTKWLSEQAFLEIENKNQKRLILRPRAIYGVGDRLILPRLLGLAKGNNFFMLGKMDVQTSQTNVRHLSSIIDYFVSSQNIGNKDIVSNIADKNSYTFGSSAFELISEITEKKLTKRVIPLSVLRAIAHTGISPKISKFLINAITYDSVLDLSYLNSWYQNSPDFTLEEEIVLMKKWLSKIGDTNIYLNNIIEAPWMI